MSDMCHRFSPAVSWGHTISPYLAVIWWLIHFWVAWQTLVSNLQMDVDIRTTLSSEAVRKCIIMIVISCCLSTAQLIILPGVKHIHFSNGKKDLFDKFWFDHIHQYLLYQITSALSPYLVCKNNEIPMFTV